MFAEQFESIQAMVQDINRKMDMLTKKEDDVDKRLSNVDKRLGGLVRQMNKASNDVFKNRASNIKIFSHYQYDFIIHSIVSFAYQSDAGLSLRKE